MHDACNSDVLSRQTKQSCLVSNFEDALTLPASYLATPMVQKHC